MCLGSLDPDGQPGGMEGKAVSVRVTVEGGYRVVTRIRRDRDDRPCHSHGSSMCLDPSRGSEVSQNVASVLKKLMAHLRILP